LQEIVAEGLDVEAARIHAPQQRIGWIARDAIRAFLVQDKESGADLETTVRGLHGAIAAGEAAS